MKLPTNIEAERDILGSIILDNNILNDLMDILSPDYFHSESFKTIYETMVDLYSSKSPVDLITLRESLKGKSIPTETLFHLADNVSMPSRAKGYVSILKDSYIKRQLVYFTNEITESIDNGVQADKILSLMVDKGFELSKPIEDNIKPLRSVIKKSMQQIEAAYENKGVVGLKTELKLDNVLHGLKPKLYILAGRPGTGKTALCLNIAANNLDANVLIFELEMPDEEIGIRMLGSDASLNTQCLESGRVKEESWGKILGACDRFNKSNIYIDDSANQTDKGIWAKCKRHKAKHGLDMVIIDYIQLMRSSSGTKNRREEIEEISRTLKKMTKDLSVPVIGLAQLSRECEKQRRRPVLSDLREAGGIEQDADVVIFTHSPHSISEDMPEDMVEAIIGKHRGGPTGFVKLRFEKETTTFKDWLDY